MPNVEWEVRHQLITPNVTVDFNLVDTMTGYVYLIYPDSYKIAPTLRVTNDDLSQTDGSYLHPRWKSGLTATMHVEFGIAESLALPDVTPACGADLRTMYETLISALDSIRSQSQTGFQRLVWYPAGLGAARILDNVQLLSWPDVSFDPPGAFIQFELDSPYPYAVDLTQQLTNITGTSATITNNGTSEMWPVVKVHGPFTNAVLVNASVTDQFGNPLQLYYDSARPGATSVAGGHYAEFDFFKGTVFLDGSGADLIAAIDPTVSEFFPLVPGANVITSSQNADFLWNPAWT